MNDQVDPELYPRLAEYLALLPEGLDSYPECQSKGTLIQTALEGHLLDDVGPGLPARILEIMRDPPAVGLWAPAVYSDAVFFVLVDRFHPTTDDILAWTRERTLRAAKSKLYRAMIRVAGPERLLKVTTAAHGLFQRGTTLEAVYGESRVSLVMRHPAYLHWGLNHLSNVAMFEALLELSGARHCRVELDASTPDAAYYSGWWE